MVAANLTSQVIAITQEYLGPASERFVHRLISFHLKKPPDQLAPADLPKLVSWIKVSLGLLTDDRTMVDECEQNLLKLANNL